jgi:exopolyphosphatase/guanosine-5'-triphosphate,3'-diphosphate pyrophosphatase
MPGLDPRRADLSVAGIVLLDTILSQLGASEFTLCDLALREGLVLDYIQRNGARIAQVDRYPDIRRRSVVELAERCHYSPAHSQHVAAVALSLFDQTRGTHGLTEREREWLEYGALLHDLGVLISYEGHHKHSYYLIKNGDLRGFEPEEVEAIALITLYHRRGKPKKNHPGYGELRSSTRRAVKILAALVSLAEGLDRSHAQIVSGVRLQHRGRDVVAHLSTTGDAELEVWAAHRHAGPLEDVLDGTLRFEVDNTSYAEQPDNAARVSRQAVRRGGHRRLRQDDAARPAGEVAERRRAPRVRHRVELVRAGEGSHEDRQEAERAHADDLQPAARHRLR